MLTEKLDRLISALGNPVHLASAVNKSSQLETYNENSTRKSMANDDAVEFDSSFVAARAEEAEQAQVRQAKVDRIASQVKAGAYSPSSEAVSVAFIKELGI